MYHRLSKKSFSFDTIPTFLAQYIQKLRLLLAREDQDNGKAARAQSCQRGNVEMRKASIVQIFATVLLGAGLMSAQAPRTWVSGVGDDVNPCSRTAPCKTWAGAISKTAAGGEIDALDPGGVVAATHTPFNPPHYPRAEF